MINPMRRVLVLSPWYLPSQIMSWEDAITLIYLGKAEAVIDYDEVVRSPSVAMPLPAVIRLKRPPKIKAKAPKFSRPNVYARDGYRCQYCGKKKRFDELTYDHVVPRKSGGRTIWENIVTACEPCNSRKGCRTCDESGMWPLKAPEKPGWMKPVGIIDTRNAPEEWAPFLQKEDHSG